MTQDATRPPQKCHECGAPLTTPDDGCQYCGHGRKAPAPKPATAATTPAAAPVEDEGAALARDISSAATTAFDKIKSFVTGQPTATAATAVAATTAAAATTATPAPAAAPKPAPAATAATPAAMEKPVRPRPQPKPDVPQRKNVAEEAPEEKPARKPLAPERAAKISALTQELRNHPSAGNVVNRVRASEADEEEEDGDEDEGDDELDELWAILGVVYYVSLADEEHDEDEQEELARIMSDLTDEEADEETLEEWIEEWDEAWEEDDSYDEMLASFAETLESDELRRQAFNLGVGIAVLDGEISDEESEVILYIADALEIPKGEARRAMRKALE